jgi:hypothetical protein
LFLIPFLRRLCTEPDRKEKPPDDNRQPGTHAAHSACSDNARDAGRDPPTRSGVFRDARAGRPFQAAGYRNRKTFITMLEMNGSSAGVVFELD